MDTSEHYFSHSADDGTINHYKVYYCICGKTDKDIDRLLRHIRWQELRLMSGAALPGVGQGGAQGDSDSQSETAS
jgi:hypothetical protein